MSIPVSINDTQQYELALLGVCEPPKAVEQSLFESIESESELIQKALAHRRNKTLPQKTIALHMGLSESAFTKMKKGRDRQGRVRHLPITTIAKFEALVGHTMVSQWIAYRRDCLFNEDVRRLAQINSEKAEIEARLLSSAA